VGLAAGCSKQAAIYDKSVCVVRVYGGTVVSAIQLTAFHLFLKIVKLF